MIWEPFVLALVLGLLVSAGLYFAYLWPDADPVEPGAASAPAPVPAAASEPAASEPATAAEPAGETSEPAAEPAGETSAPAEVSPS